MAKKPNPKKQHEKRIQKTTQSKKGKTGSNEGRPRIVGTTGKTGQRRGGPAQGTTPTKKGGRMAAEGTTTKRAGNTPVKVKVNRIGKTSAQQTGKKGTAKANRTTAAHSPKKSRPNVRTNRIYNNEGKVQRDETGGFKTVYTIPTRGKDLDRINEHLKKGIDPSILKKGIEKQKTVTPTGIKGFKPPRAVMVTIKYRDAEGKIRYYSKPSGFDFAVTPETTLELAAEAVSDLQDLEGYGVNEEDGAVISTSFRFIY